MCYLPNYMLRTTALNSSTLRQHTISIVSSSFVVCLVLLASNYELLLTFKLVWWAQMDLNHRPHAYQACALTI